MSKNNYMFKSDLVELIQEQTGLERKYAILEANRILMLSEDSFADKSLGSRIFDFAGSSIYSGLIQNFTEQILDYMGIKRSTPLGRVIANFIENLTFDQVKAYTSGWEEGQCEAFMKSLVDVVFESFSEYLIDLVISKLKSGDEFGIPQEGPVSALLSDFGEKFGDIGNLTKAISSIIREKIFDVLFPQESRQELVAFLCDEFSELEFSLDNITSMIGFGDDEDEE